jgi:hypothetical protein
VTAGVADARRDVDPAFGVPDSSSETTFTAPSPPPTPDVSLAAGSAILPFRDVGTDENVELDMESEGVDGDGEERENGIVVINPIACALRIVFLAWFIPTTLLLEADRFLGVPVGRPDPVVDSEDMDPDSFNGPSRRTSSPSLPLIDARLERETPCRGCVWDILFPVHREGGSVADSGMAELCR